MSRNRQPWPRVMFSISMPLKAARSVIIRFKCTQHVVELDAAVPQAEVLVQLVQDPPGVEREPVADGGGDAAQLVQRRAQAGVWRLGLNRNASSVCSSSRSRHPLPETRAGSSFRSTSTLQQRHELGARRRSCPRRVRRTTKLRSRRSVCSARSA